MTLEYPAGGGVVLTVPAGLGRRPGPFAVAMQSFVARLLPLLAKPPAPRAVLRLTAEGLSMTEPHEEAPGDTVTQSWPLKDIGEIRANRFGPGLYVSIPGRHNFDTLVDLDRQLVQWIGRELEAALQRLRENDDPSKPSLDGASSAPPTVPGAAP